eukprot:4954066-Alexandrium_andersonii.AAC.1
MSSRLRELRAATTLRGQCDSGHPHSRGCLWRARNCRPGCRQRTAPSPTGDDHEARGYAAPPSPAAPEGSAGRGVGACAGL